MLWSLRLGKSSNNVASWPHWLQSRDAQVRLTMSELWDKALWLLSYQVSNDLLEQQQKINTSTVLRKKCGVRDKACLRSSLSREHFIRATKVKHDHNSCLSDLGFYVDNRHRWVCAVQWCVDIRLIKSFTTALVYSVVFATNIPTSPHFPYFKQLQSFTYFLKNLIKSNHLKSKRIWLLPVFQELFWPCYLKLLAVMFSFSFIKWSIAFHKVLPIIIFKFIL